jgi:hypothetical protein
LDAVDVARPVRVVGTRVRPARLGFTFFSGAVEAWLVDALTSTGYTGSLEAVFGRGLVVSGIRDARRLGAGWRDRTIYRPWGPFPGARGVLVLMFLFAFFVMKDMGFTPDRSMAPMKATRNVLAQSVEHGLKRRSVRYMILAAPFASGVGMYAFYALQPYLLELYGDTSAYSVAGWPRQCSPWPRLPAVCWHPGYGSVRQTNDHGDRSLPRQRCHAGCAGFQQLLLVCGRPPGGLGIRIRRGGTSEAGVPQRHDPVEAGARLCCRSTRCSAALVG